MLINSWFVMNPIDRMTFSETNSLTHARFQMPGIEITNRAMADTMQGMGWLLGKDISPEQGLAGLMGPTA
jgi:hypothetical protein